MAQMAETNLIRAMNTLVTRDQKEIDEVYRVEENINFLNKEITNYLVHLNQASLPTSDVMRIGALFHVVNDIERALKHIIARGSLEVARRVHTLIVSIFKYALAKDLIQQPDIVVRLSWYKDQMPKRRRQSLYSEELGPEDVGKLLRSIDEHKNRWTVPVSMALQLAPYCAVRPSELLEAKWTEFNLDAAEWIIPSERMKVGRPHLVPLPRQAVELFKKMYAFSRTKEWVFPSTSSIGAGKPVSSMALIQAFRKMGYTAENGNRFVTHAFRGLFSTTAYNILGASSLAVELQLAHVEQNKVKAAYHKTSLRTALAERRALLQQYADYLDELRAKALKAME
jgi:integrase